MAVAGASPPPRPRFSGQLADSTPDTAPRPRSRPDQMRQRHRFPARDFAINQAWLTAVVRRRSDRVRSKHRPARPAPTGQCRTEDTALPATARRRPHHPRTRPTTWTHRPDLALGRRPRPRFGRVRLPQPSRLTRSPSVPTSIRSTRHTAGQQVNYAERIEADYEDQLMRSRLSRTC